MKDIRAKLRRYQKRPQVICSNCGGQYVINGPFSQPCYHCFPPTKEVKP